MLLHQDHTIELMRWLVQKDIIEGYPSRISLADKGHKWLDEADHNQLIEKYKHPLWDKLKAGIEKYGGHGGMDFVMIYRLIDSLNNGWFLDQDVYDAASWSVVIPLSTLSIELGSTPLKFPDFTRGRWNENRELGILKIINCVLLLIIKTMIGRLIRVSSE